MPYSPANLRKNYRQILKDLRSGGMKEVLLFVSNGLKELRNIFLEEYPKAKHQACWVHIDRAISRNIRRQDSREVFEDLKKIYRSQNEDEALKAYDFFIGKYETRYPKAASILKNCPSLFTFYYFPKGIRRSIYTSNLIEAFNKQLKREIRKKEQLPNEDSLDRFTCVKAIDCNNKSSRKTMKGFLEASYELNQLFEKTYGTKSKEFTQNS